MIFSAAMEDMDIKPINCFVRLSVGHALKDINLMFKGLVIFFQFLHILSLLVIVVTNGHLVYNSLCPFVHSLNFCASLLMISVILVNFKYYK